MPLRRTDGMKHIAYIITYAVLRLLAILPRPLLYLKADTLGFILNHVAGYRKKVITRNLSSAFPDYSERQIRTLRNKVYRHLADVITEVAVFQFYSRSRLEKRFTFENPELIEKYYKEGRHIIVMGGHYNNWEWSVPFAYTFRHKLIGVYKPLHNKYFDSAYRKARTRFGAEMMPMGTIGRKLFEYNNKKIPTITGMVGDQRPIKNHIQYWTSFLNHKTGFFSGSEKLARKFNAVVLFIHVSKVKRGAYHATLEVISENPSATAPNEITENYVRLLEKMILEEPAYWLWSHNRWKFTYEEWLRKNPSPLSTDPSA
jgi:Kdo2-lipid IVA lauroyltransferase/acyltransferase